MGSGDILSDMALARAVEAAKPQKNESLFSNYKPGETLIDQWQKIPGYYTPPKGVGGLPTHTTQQQRRNIANSVMNIVFAAPSARSGTEPATASALPPSAARRQAPSRRRPGRSTAARRP